WIRLMPLPGSSGLPVPVMIPAQEKCSSSGTSLCSPSRSRVSLSQSRQLIEFSGACRNGGSDRGSAESVCCCCCLSGWCCCTIAGLVDGPAVQAVNNSTTTSVMLDPASTRPRLATRRGERESLRGTARASLAVVRSGHSVGSTIPHGRCEYGESPARCERVLPFAHRCGAGCRPWMSVGSCRHHV